MTPWSGRIAIRRHRIIRHPWRPNDFDQLPERLFRHRATRRTAIFSCIEPTPERPESHVQALVLESSRSHFNNPNCRDTLKQHAPLQIKTPVGDDNASAHDLRISVN